MNDKLSFHLVSPERELFSGPVDQVVVPGSEGDFAVLPKHAPVMSAIRPGAITVTDGGAVRKIFVLGGFADVTPDGLTILAEEAIDDHRTFPRHVRKRRSLRRRGDEVIDVEVRGG